MLLFIYKNIGILHLYIMGEDGNGALLKFHVFYQEYYICVFKLFVSYYYPPPPHTHTHRFYEMFSDRFKKIVSFLLLWRHQIYGTIRSFYVGNSVLHLALKTSSETCLQTSLCRD